jgi:cytoskeleton-associated protein 5
MKSGSSNRFGDEDTDDFELLPIPPSPAETKGVSTFKAPTPEPVKSLKINSSIPSSIPPPVPTDDDIQLTKETLPDALESTMWKYRKAGYDLLMSMLSDQCEGKVADSSIDGNDVMSLLDNIVCKMVKDSNAGALDSALRFAILYADHCVMACDSEQAGRIAENIVKGPALASSRPSTSKLTTALLMKLMEVSRDGVTSIHAVIDALMTHGVNSKKPKVVIKSAGLVLDTVSAFGAATLPLSTISANISKIVSHANGVVRENGIKIIAEICCAIGSKDPLNDVISSMKAAQVSQLDSVLSKMSTPSTPTLGLRFQKGCSASPVDLVAAIQAGSAEEEARKFAERPAINLLSKLKDSEYKQKMKEAKWSEKAGALDLLISCAGEKPFKLVQPSASVNYSPLITELRQLLGHTHFAVNSKAMGGLAMLAEGVGEKLFSKLKPFLPVLLEKSKDKKLTRAVSSCLDSLFGNVIGFSSILEEEDALPLMLDEKKQKNVLIRKNSLAFLKRCVDRSPKCEDRGAIDVSSAQEVANLCSKKLKDSDAGVRNEAISVLASLVQHNDQTISDISHRIVKDLETSNPRAYKTITRIISESGQTSNDGPSGTLPKPSQNRSARAARVNRIPKGPSSPQKTLPKKRGHTPSPGNRISAGKLPPKIELIADFEVEDDAENLPVLDDAIAFLSGLNIENWDAPEDEGGVLLGLKSSNWKFRREAIDTLSRFTTSDKSSDAGNAYVQNVLSFVKGHTKNFRESNFNLCKAVMELFSAITQLRISTNVAVEVWICKYAVQLATEKIADKKFISIAPPLLERLCEGQHPEIVISLALKTVESIKSPTPHEGLLLWMKKFCIDFGVNALGKSVSPLVKWSLTVSFYSIETSINFQSK